MLATRSRAVPASATAIRSILLDAQHTEMSPRAEALLFNAARAQLVDEVIRPALAAGMWVLCDRYADSTLAYQGYGHSQPLEPLRQLGRYATRGLTPDLTIYLDIDVGGLGAQTSRRGRRVEPHGGEEAGLSPGGARRLPGAGARRRPRWLVIDAGQNELAVQHDILRAGTGADSHRLTAN